MTSPDVDALVFDVFGTVVDWRSGVIRDGEKLGAIRDIDVDWAAFANAWREEYQPSMDRVRDGEIPWQNLDALHRDSLETLLVQFGIEAFTEADKDWFINVWHRLDPWPDSIPGLHRLRTEYLVATLSNGHVRLLADMAKRAGIPWDLILSAELSGHYKPAEKAYLRAVDLLDVAPNRVMMVAAHEMDLAAASKAGLRTAYVHRPLEWGPDEPSSMNASSDSTAEIAADDFVELADILDA